MEQTTATSPPTRSRSRSHSRRRRMAVADALAGVVGSLVSLWVFYPMEVYKTQVQAAPSSTSSTVVSSSAEKKQQQSSSCRRRLESLLAAGWKWKTLHTASSSFCYFFLYSWIVSLWTTTTSTSSSSLLLRKRQDGITASSAKTTPTNISTAARLLLSATAAMFNTFLTLPLDVVAARQQNEQQQQQLKESTLWRIQEENYYDADALDEENDQESEENKEKREAAFSQEEEKKEDIIFEWKNANQHEVSTANRISSREDGSSLAYILSLWRGLGPSLLLCTNPAINYTCFDTMKSRILLHRQSSSNNNNSNKNNLTMREAFFLGILAKFVATIVTYPLIRTKVMLMVAATSPAPSSSLFRGTRTTTTSGMIECLKDEYKANGMRGLYQGCNLQLLHTLLKSALLMMIRERLTRTTSRLVLGNNDATSRES